MKGLPAKQVTIQTIYRAGYSKLEIMFRDRKIAAWGAGRVTPAVAVT
jgi:hypothetical protein